MARGSEKSACEEEGEEQWNVMTQMTGSIYFFGNCTFIRYDARYPNVFLLVRHLPRTLPASVSRESLHYV